MKKLFLSTMLLLCGFVSTQAQELDAKYAVGLLSPGTQAPDMRIHSLDGGELSLSELREENGSYQFLVLDSKTGVKQPKEAIDAGLNEVKTINYDFDDAKVNTPHYIEDWMTNVNKAAPQK